MRAKLTDRLLEGAQAPEAGYRDIWDASTTGLFARVSSSGVISFYFHYRHDGQKRTTSLGKWGRLTVTQAREAARQAAARVALGEDVQTKRQESRQKAKQEAEAHTLASFIDGPYGEWRMAHRKHAKDSLDRVRLCFFKEFGGTKLKGITAWSIEKWRSARLKSGIKPVTVNRDLAELRVALSRAVEWGFLEGNPLSAVKPARVDSRPSVRFLSPAEELRLRNALKDRDTTMRAKRRSANQWRMDRGRDMLPSIPNTAYADHLSPLVLLAINTGMRKGELFSLEWSSVNLSARQLTIHGDNAKSGQTRHVPLNQDALSVLETWGKTSTGSGLVFPGKDGKPLDNVQSAWESVLAAAGIESFRFHDLRHTFASKLVMAGVDLNTVRELLGHADIKMTLRYAHLAPEHKQAAVELLCAK